MSIQRTKLISNQLDLLVVYIASCFPLNKEESIIHLNYNIYKQAVSQIYMYARAPSPCDYLSDRAIQQAGSKPGRVKKIENRTQTRAWRGLGLTLSANRRNLPPRIPTNRLGLPTSVDKLNLF